MNTITFPKLGLEFQISETAFRIGDFSIKWYAIIIMTGLLLALFFGHRNARKFGVDMDILYEPILYATLAAIAGARIYYCIFNFDAFKDNLWSIFYIHEGGLAIYGAIIAIVVTGIIYCRAKKLPFMPIFDMVAMGLLIGQGVGRWGNFVNAEAFGANTTLPWGMHGPDIERELYLMRGSLLSQGVSINPEMPVHPTFLYESIWCLLGFLLLRLFLKHRRYDGQILLMYLTWYGFERMIVEGLRTDSLMIGNLRVSQMLSGLLFVAGLVGLIFMYFKIRSKGDKEYLKLYVNTDASKELLAKIDADREAEKKKKNVKKTRKNDTENMPESSEGTENVD